MRARDIFERRHRSVFGWLLRMTGRRETAEDLTQEVFLRVARAADRYQERGREAAWVFRIARNVWRNHLRDRPPRREPLDDVPSLGRRSGHTLRPDLEEALAGLDATDRACFLMRELGGLSYRDIADACELTMPAVRSRIYRARKALRQRLTPLDPTEVSR